MAYRYYILISYVNGKKAFFFNRVAFKSENITMATSANEIKRDSRMQAQPRFITVIMNAYDDTAMK